MEYFIAQEKTREKIQCLLKMMGTKTEKDVEEEISVYLNSLTVCDENVSL